MTDSVHPRVEGSPVPIGEWKKQCVTIQEQKNGTILGKSTRIFDDIHTESDAWMTRYLDPQVLQQGHRNGSIYERFAEPGTVASFGLGWTDAADADTDLRMDPNKLTHLRTRRQLQTRPFLTVPYLGTGGGDADLESALWTGVEERGPRGCSSASMIENDRLKDPLPSCLHPTSNYPIYPGIRGGEGTRTPMRRTLQPPVSRGQCNPMLFQ
jgi:hypothetical protein